MPSRRCAVILTIATLLSISASRAQEPAVAFEVASVKPNHSGSGNSSMHTSKGQMVMENIPLKDLIERAYDVRDYTLTGPAWLSAERFDITAKPPAAAPPEQLSRMLQSLLAERFGLKAHRESKQFSGYALVAGKQGSKAAKAEHPEHGSMSSGRGMLKGRAVTMAVFADLLARQLDRPVQNLTNLDGVFDLEMKWTPDEAATAPGGESKSDNSGPSIFAALQEQLGLRLQAQKVPVSVLIIDHIERVPTEN